MLVVTDHSVWVDNFICIDGEQVFGALILVFGIRYSGDSVGLIV